MMSPLFERFNSLWSLLFSNLGTMESKAHVHKDQVIKYNNIIIIMSLYIKYNNIIIIMSMYIFYL